MMNENELEKKPQILYSNGVDIATSPYDLIISISRNSPSEREILADIIMSPEHAKVFSTILSHNIENYERLFGQIPDVHPDTLEKLHQEGKIDVSRNGQ